MSLLLAASLAATPPDPGQQDFAALTALAGGLVATAFGLARRERREDIQWLGFLGAFLGGVLGLSLYLLGLVTNLY